MLSRMRMACGGRICRQWMVQSLGRSLGGARRWRWREAGSCKSLQTGKTCAKSGTTVAERRCVRREVGRMETTEKIVESYCRYVKQWFTIPNIKCEGQYEVDLLAVDTTSPKKLKRYHIECGVSISGSYSKLTAKPFSTEQLRIRVQQAGQRRTFGFFIERKFEQKEVEAELK